MAQVALSPADVPSWVDFITQFDTTFNAFMTNYDALMQLGPYIQSNHPELQAQYDAMVNTGADNYNRLMELKATRDYVYSWLQWLQSGASDVSSFVTSSAQSVYDGLKSFFGLGEYQFQRFDGFGFVPVAYAVIGAAAGIAALVAITKWITDAYTFAQRLNALQDLESKGMTPAQAAATVNATLGPPASNDFLGIPWSLLIWGALALAFGPPLLKMLSGDRR